jgi:lipid A 3-O-deacylase
MRLISWRWTPIRFSFCVAGVLRTLLPLLLLLSCFGILRPASAQQIEALVLRFDNDILALRGTGKPPDYDYTHGLYLKAEFGGLPWGLSQLMGATDAGRVRSHVGAGQRIYTPRRDGAEPVPGERPYAGWLFVDAGVRLAGPDAEHRFEVEIGMTGPAALSEPVQNGFHRLVGSTLQEGWDHQLRTEVAGLVRYGIARTHRIGRSELKPEAEVALGTLWSGAAGGAELRYGAAPEARGLSAAAGVRQEWVAWNLFLDGNTFGTSVRAEKRSWVSEAAVSLGYGFERWDVEYRFVARSREYAAQPSAHGYGSVAIRWRK